MRGKPRTLERTMVAREMMEGEETGEDVGGEAGDFMWLA